MIKLAQAGVTAVLKDPGSATFGSNYVAARSPTGSINICGVVNAKNSFGGYVGASPFIAEIRDGKVVDAHAAGGSSAEFLVMVCRDRGVPI
jgi:hypothetical protein